MASRKAFLLRIDPELWRAIEAWAADELRSVNGQIEYLLANAVKDAGRSRSSKTRERPRRPPGESGPGPRGPDPEERSDRPDRHPEAPEGEEAPDDRS
jgi:hypothetical protein